MFVLDRIPIHDQFLTAREAEVVLLIAEGLVTSLIAQRLFVSIKTVNRHRENIRLRFGLKGYYGLQQFAQKMKPEVEKWVK